MMRPTRAGLILIGFIALQGVLVVALTWMAPARELPHGIGDALFARLLLAAVAGVVGAQLFLAGLVNADARGLTGIVPNFILGAAQMVGGFSFTVAPAVISFNTWQDPIASDFTQWCLSLSALLSVSTAFVSFVSRNPAALLADDDFRRLVEWLRGSLITKTPNW